MSGRCPPCADRESLFWVLLVPIADADIFVGVDSVGFHAADLIVRTYAARGMGVVLAIMQACDGAGRMGDISAVRNGSGRQSSGVPAPA